MGYTDIASERSIASVTEALKTNGFVVQVVENGEAASQAARQLLPKGGEVLTVSSKTIDDIGLRAIVNESGEYNAVHPQLAAMMKDPQQARQQRKLGAAPDFVVGSVHAITESGEVLIASATGSQLAPYVYGAGTVVWVVGAQKIVPNLDEAWRRLREHIFPLENARLQKAMGMPSSINKVLIFNKEFRPERVHIILVKEALGF